MPIKLNPKIKNLIPLPLTFVVFLSLIFLLYLEILGLNLITNQDISTAIHWQDVLIGLTIYLKTSVDFAIFIGNLMHKNPGLKGRIGIEIGTALGNALGTMIILIIWTFFKEVTWLLALMITLAALVLFKMAEDSLEHADIGAHKIKLVHLFHRSLVKFNSIVEPFLSKIIPSHSIKPRASKSFIGLLLASFSVPFILGLDDFAGYVPLFNVVNVLGFSIGVLLGHMILNILLFISPARTIKFVKNRFVSLIGAIAFILLGVWGIYEAVKLILNLH
ncbi:MAG TPA: hypothetical protein PKA29_00600 [Candidatus Saccharibacteria bacterium]|nr:hypothetical protein [Candidatus Saccharibacteria bacterium]